MTSASATILSAIQRDAFAWAKKNFGASLTPETQLLGLCEEHGEACEAMALTEDFVDAVGDGAIFLFQFSSLMQWDVGQLWDTRTHGLDMPSRPWPILIGKICHAYVKGRVQHYRGTTAEHDANCRAAIQTLLRHWDHHTESIGHDFVAVVEMTWKKVSARDWAAVRPAPGERNPLNEMFGLMKDEPAPEPAHTAFDAIERTAAEIEGCVPAEQRMSEELSFEWADGARGGGTKTIAATIRRAYAQGIIVGKVKAVEAFANSAEKT